MTLTRRSFLAALAGLPLIGRLVKQPAPLAFHPHAISMVWPMPGTCAIRQGVAMLQA